MEKAWKRLEVGSRVEQAGYWTLVFLIGEAGHFRRAINGDGTICRSNAGLRPSVMPFSPAQLSHSHLYVPVRSFHARAEHV